MEQRNTQNHNYVNKIMVATKSRFTAGFPFNKLNIKFIVKNNTLKKKLCKFPLNLYFLICICKGTLLFTVQFTLVTHSCPIL